jgi:hypothetical protein
MTGYGMVEEATRADDFRDKVVVVSRCGRICLGNKKINFSQVFAGQALGIKEVHDDIWLVSFMDYDLGTSIWRPEFWNRWKIPSAHKCYPCSRYILLPMSPGWTPERIGPSRRFSNSPDDVERL